MKKALCCLLTAILAPSTPGRPARSRAMASSRRPQAAGRRSRRRGFDPRGHPGLGHQQRRLAQDRIYGAERRGAGEGDLRGLGDGRRRRRNHHLCRGTRDGHPARRSDRGRRTDSSLRRLDEPPRLLCPGIGQDELGHLDTASGVVGLIKTVLALKNRLIPPSLHFEEPNPASISRTAPSTSTAVSLTGVPAELRGAPG